MGDRRNCNNDCFADKLAWDKYRKETREDRSRLKPAVLQKLAFLQP